MNKHILLATAALVMGATAYGQTGNVGIGTTAPNAKLDVRGGVRAEKGTPGTANDNANKGYTFGIDGDTGFFADSGTAGSGSELQFRSDNQNLMTIKRLGNVGIGEPNPSAKLHVNGNIRINDGTQAAGKVMTSSSDGTAHWDYPAVTYQNLVSPYKSTNNSTVFYGSMLSTSDTFYRNTGAYIDLPPGKFLVQISGNASTTPVYSIWYPNLTHIVPYDTANYAHFGEILYAYAFLLDQNVNSIPRDQYDGPTAISSLNTLLIPLYFPFRFISGNNNLVVYNNTTATKRYYVFARAIGANLQAPNRRIYEFMNGRWGEENLSAIKIGD